MEIRIAVETQKFEHIENQNLIDLNFRPIVVGLSMIHKQTQQTNRYSTTTIPIWDEMID